MYPLKFNPILKSMIWGGEKLRQYKAIETDQYGSLNLDFIRNMAVG